MFDSIKYGRFRKQIRVARLNLSTQIHYRVCLMFLNGKFLFIGSNIATVAFIENQKLKQLTNRIPNYIIYI